MRFDICELACSVYVLSVMCALRRAARMLSYCCSGRFALNAVEIFFSFIFSR